MSIFSGCLHQCTTPQKTSRMCHHLPASLVLFIPCIFQNTVLSILACIFVYLFCGGRCDCPPIREQPTLIIWLCGGSIGSIEINCLRAQGWLDDESWYKLTHKHRFTNISKCNRNWYECSSNTLIFTFNIKLCFPLIVPSTMKAPINSAFRFDSFGLNS